MTRLYFDHDVSFLMAAPLRAAGHDVITARAAALAHATDDEQLLTAAQQGRVLLTHNRKDYVLLHNAWLRWPAAWSITAPAHAGILVCDHRPAPELTLAVETFLASTPPVTLASALYWWRHRAGWHRLLPDRQWVAMPSSL